jgi:hypothetical protein
VLQVTNTDPTITPLIGHYLGTVTSRLAVASIDFTNAVGVTTTARLGGCEHHG